MSEKVLITKSKLDSLAKKIIAKAESSGKKTIDELGELVDGIVTPEIVEQATPSIEVDVNGKITASATQTEGYVVGGTKSSTKQLTTKGATRYTPSTIDFTIPSGTYLIGAQTIKGDSNLISSNIKKNVSIFGVTGTYEGSSTAVANDMLQARIDSNNSCDYLFYRYTGTNVDFIINLNTSNVTKMGDMFSGCSNLTTIPQIDTSNVTDMGSMFSGCSNLTTIPQIDTSNVTDMGSMFYNCSNLTTIPQIDTSKVTTLYRFLYSCYKINKIDISYYNIGTSTTYSSNLFYNCYSLKAIIIRGFGSRNSIQSNSFTNCYHILGTTNSTYNPNGDKDGYIYVPRDKIDTLSSATNWSTHASQLRALEDYTVDGTTTGEFDDAKAGL